MADKSITQTIKDAEIDARSLSEFIYKPATAMINRRLAPPIHSLSYYLDFLSETVAKSSQKMALADQYLDDAVGIVASIEPTVVQMVNDAIDNTAIEGGVVADTFVTVVEQIDGDGAINQRQLNSMNTLTVPDIATLKKVKPVLGKTVRVLETDGVYEFVTGDYSHELTLDTQGGVFVEAFGYPNGSGMVAKRIIDGGYINAEWFGVSPDIDNNTPQIQAAMLVANNLGVPVVTLPKGRLYIGLSGRLESTGILQIPEGVHLKGAGMYSTEIDYAIANRATAVSYFKNIGVSRDTEHLGSASNFTISDLSLINSDEVEQGGISFMSIGNCRNVTIERVFFGNHSRHGVDMAGVDGVTIRDCVAKNNVVSTYRNSSVFQIDGVGGIGTMAAPKFNTRNVLIENCDLRTNHSSELLDIGHKPREDGLVSNIVVRGCYLEGAPTGSDRVVRFGKDQSYKDIVFENNTVVGLANESFLFWLSPTPDQSGGNTLNNIHIKNNHFTGTGRFGIVVRTEWSGFPDVSGPIYVTNNTVDMTVDNDSDINTGILIQGVRNCKVHGNNVRMTSPLRHDKGMTGIVAYRADADVSENTVNVRTPTLPEGAVPTTNCRGIAVLSLTGATIPDKRNYISISNNTIDQSDVRVAILISGADNVRGIDNVSVSRNVFTGELVDSHHTFSIYDGLGGCSDLSNGGRLAFDKTGETTLSISSGASIDVTSKSVSSSQLAVAGIATNRGVRFDVSFLYSQQSGFTGARTYLPITTDTGFAGLVFDTNHTSSSNSVIIKAGSGGVSGYLDESGVSQGYTSASVLINTYI